MQKLVQQCPPTRTFDEEHIEGVTYDRTNGT